ncbi:substrate-binding domain-containing protein [Butyrivibrio sp. MC2013]|uniref:substrate-binding domain-containing protein n=1 Tax=Butyrivibrio sp. MC2013 TaxID=1280686 RepID=UPI00047D8001|nr:substrate-binding domain-containing protein [Butyrivibrio sp. MC2013]
MRKKFLSMVCCLSMTAALLAGCSSATEGGNTEGTAETASETTAGDDGGSTDYKIALITMDSIDQHWVTLNEGAQAEAAKEGVTVDFMSPDTKDDSKQIECVNNAIAGGYNAIMVAANGPDAISGALKEAIDAGIKIVYVDSPANVDAEATFSTDNKAAGKTAGEQMLKALDSKGISSGDIGVVNVNASTQSTVDREAGFREAFDGSAFNILETQYCDGDAAKAQNIAENYITQGVVGIFGGNEGSTTGTGNAIKASGNTDIVGVGFDKSDSIQGLIKDGYLLCTMAQNPDVMGAKGVEACVKALKGEKLGGAVTDTGVSILDAAALGGAASAADDGAGDAKAAGDYKIALITMDSIDQHWVTLNEGAQAAAAEAGVTVDFMSPDTKDDSKQIECVNNAVAGGYDAIMVAANGPDAISGALKEAIDAGIKIVYVDSPANVDAEATYSTDNKMAGKIAGEEMLSALSDKGITSGDIGIVNVNASTQSTVDREAGFREAFDGSDFNILETQYCDGDAAKAQSIAENYITQGVVGIFGGNEGSTTGAGNAIKASGNADIIGVGFDKSDSIKGLITDGYLLCTMAQNPDVMGSKGVEACVKALNGDSLGGEVVDTGVTVLKKGDF